MITVVKTVPSLPRSLSGFMGASVVTAAFTFPIEEGAFEGVDTMLPSASLCAGTIWRTSGAAPTPKSTPAPECVGMAVW
jgi:hypothetical protein